MTLHFYFARRFAIIFVELLAAFAVMVYLLDLIEQLRVFGKHEVPFGQVMMMTLLNAPDSLHPFLPLVMILSTIALFLGLSRSSELVVVRAAGRAALVTLLSPLVTALVIGILLVTTYGPIAAATSKRYDQLAQRLTSETASILSVGREGVWLRQGGPEGQTVIHANRANADGSQLFDVTFVAYAPKGGPVRRIEAARAELEDGFWRLQEAKVWPLVAGLNPETSLAEHTELRVVSRLDRDRIQASLVKVGTIPIWEMPDFIAQLREAGFSPRRHLVWLHMELALPVFLLAMVLIGAALTMRPVRFGRVGLAVLTAVILGFMLYYIRNFARILGENGQIPYLLAAWAPPVAAVLLGLGLLLQMEDG